MSDYEPNPETEEKILAHLDSEWANFLRLYQSLDPQPGNKSTVAALKAGFYSGFISGVCAMHDADKIL